jgi:hypothetical protein
MKLASLVLIFSVSACAANTPSATTVVKAKGNSSISGQIQYPAKQVPAMQVCAVNTQTQAATCIKTKTGQTKYLIEGLAAAEYQIIANLTSGELHIGGHMLQVQCIRAPCPALLNSLVLKANEPKTDIHVNGFYASREDFPMVSTAKKP